MDLHVRKIQLAQDVLRLQDEKIVLGLEKMLKKRRFEKYELELRPMSVEELNRRIDKSEDDFKNKHFKTSEELFAKYKK